MVCTVISKEQLNHGGFPSPRMSRQSRRGEASGLYSGVQSSSSILFPAFALWLLHASFGGFAMVFVATALFSFAGAALGALMTRYMPTIARSNAARDPARPWWREIFISSNRTFSAVVTVGLAEHFAPFDHQLQRALRP